LPFGFSATAVYDDAMAIHRACSLAALAAAVGMLAGCAAGSSPPSPPEQTSARSTSPAPVAAPKWQVGDRWLYEWTFDKESGTKTVEVVDLREVNGVSYYVVRLSGRPAQPGDDSEHYYTEALHWAAAVRDGKVEARMVPPHPWFTWPLVAGTRWTHQGRFEQREGTVTFDDRFVVMGPEPVEVPAGRYEAIRLMRQTDRRDADEYWYVPDVRWYVRWVGRRGDSQFEERLREYRAAASRPR
jgi:hypothetical protein